MRNWTNASEFIRLCLEDIYIHVYIYIYIFFFFFTRGQFPLKKALPL